MRIQLAQRWEDLRASYWFLPSLMSACAGVLSAVALRLDGRFGDRIPPDAWWLFAGGSEAARATLGVIASSMITVASLVFSITIVSLTLASGQFGPRLLRNFMRDRANQIVLGTFVSTFIYSLLVLRAVRSVDGRAFVPHIAVTVALLLVIASVGVLIFFIHHISSSIQADSVVRSAASQLGDAIHRLFPDPVVADARRKDTEMVSPWSADRPSDDCIRADRADYVQAIDTDRLVEIAEAHDLIIRLACRPGDFVMAGAAVAVVRSERTPIERRVREAVGECVALGPLRTLSQDAEFGFLQLVEIAVRALSPGINDPFTAITCIDRLCSALGQLAGRDFPSSLVAGAAGKIRLIADSTSFQGFADTTFNQIRQNGGNSPAVLVRVLKGITAILPMMANKEQVGVLDEHAHLILDEGRANLRGRDLDDLCRAHARSALAVRGRLARL